VTPSAAAAAPDPVEHRSIIGVVLLQAGRLGTKGNGVNPALHEHGVAADAERGDRGREAHRVIGWEDCAEGQSTDKEAHHE
jgi:hypothetical protein